MNNKKFLSTAIFLVALTFSTNAQTSKYFIKFKNKNGTPYSVSTPSAYLSSQAINRRTQYSVPIDQTDLPVTPSYVTQVDNVPNVSIRYTSKWLNGVMIVTTSTAAINTINSFSFVLSSTPANATRPLAPIEDKTGVEAQAKETAQTFSYNHGGSYWQNHQLGVDCLHNQGFRGQGMTIAVLDDGFSNADVNPVFDSLRNRGGILGTQDFVDGGQSVYEDDQHGAMVLSCMAAIKPGVIMGSAPRANYWLLRTEDANTETPSEEYNWVRGAEFADSAGADILTTSLGYNTFNNASQDHTFNDLDGKTVPMSIAATMASRKGLFVLNAAGNGGGSSWSLISIPADADSICTVGAIDSTGNVAFFSSTGPTADGRIKPDLVARGVASWVSYPSGNCGPNNGTSFATPILAGAVACFWQAHKTWNNMKILDTLRQTASNASSPNNQRGWGTPNMCAIPAGLNEINIDRVEFVVWPNPATNHINLRFEAPTGQALPISVYNYIGELVISQTIPNSIQQYAIDISDLAKCVYFISTNNNSVKKIVKQ
jgi:hypothetical protein